VYQRGACPHILLCIIVLPFCFHPLQELVLFAFSCDPQNPVPQKKHIRTGDADLKPIMATLIKSWRRKEIWRGNQGFLTKLAVFLLKLSV
jgi:hypothetical protein